MTATKYTEQQLNEVERLKRLGTPSSKITELTGVPNHKIKEVAKLRGIKVSYEDRNRNATEARHGGEKPNLVHESESYILKMKERKVILEKEVLDIIKDSKITLVNIPSHQKHTNMTFNCKKHGDFERSYYLLKETQICISCSRIGKPQHAKYTIEQVKKFVTDRDFELISTEYLHSKSLLDIKCPKHGVFKMHINSFNSGQGCRKCSCTSTQQEIEMQEYVKSLGFGDMVVKDRSKLLNTNAINPKRRSYLEIDCLVPSKNLALEMDGLYWHSRKRDDDEVKKNEKDGEIYTEEDLLEIEHERRVGHYNKFKLTEDNGLSFFGIFTDEWISKQNLVKGMIRNRLGIFENKIRASKLEFKILTKNDDFFYFFDTNHIDGHTRASFAYALMLGDKIISCMSFRVNRKDSLMEIARYATDYNYKVYGAFSKMIQQYPRDTDLLSFSNNRIGNGNVYKIHGFEQVEIGDSKIGYCYTDFKIRVNRHSCQKKNDPAILAFYDTEEEQALAGILSEPFGHKRSIYKIFDYGKKKWILRKK